MKKLAKKMTNPYYFTDTALQLEFNITLESHHINHTHSKIITKPNFLNFRIVLRQIIKILNKMATIYARLKNQNKLNYLKTKTKR